MAVAISLPRPDKKTLVEATAAAGSAQIKPLTGLRFLAALLVVVFHFGVRAHASLPTVFSAGYLGVNFFFILSGFILAYNYLDVQGKMRASRRAFWVARFARIYPVYFLAFIVAAFPYVWEHHSPAATVATGLAGLTLIQAWIPNHAGIAWNGPSWSLSAEAFFYLLFPVAALYVSRLRRRDYWIALVGLWLVSMAFAAALWYIASIRGGYGSHVSWYEILQFNPLVRLPEFLMGIVLGMMFMSRAEQGPGTGSKLSGLAGVVSLAALAGIAAAFILSPLLPWQLVNNGLFDPIFALLIFSVAFGKGPLAAALSTPALILLGEASYAVYILHYPTWDWMTHLLRSQPVNTPAYLAGYIGLVVSLALLSFLLLERPARRYLRHALMSRPRRG